MPRKRLQIANSLILFLSVITALAFVGYGLLQLFNVGLKSEWVPDISGPVSRFVANIDFDSGTVNLDATISKTTDAEKKITIWRMGDGKVIKSSSISGINENESLEYKFETPGAYTIGYSIIDTNDLSDEAFCTITFPADQEQETNTVSSTCGKSYQSYNQAGGINAINTYRSQIRSALLQITIGIGLLIGGFATTRLVNRLFVDPRPVAEKS